MRRVLSLTALALLLGCTTGGISRLEVGVVRPPVPPSMVRIYTSRAALPEHYVEVALVSATGGFQDTGEARLLEELRKKAGEAGANALLYEGVERGLGERATPQARGIALWIDDGP